MTPTTTPTPTPVTVPMKVPTKAAMAKAHVTKHRSKYTLAAVAPTLIAILTFWSHVAPIICPMLPKGADVCAKSVQVATLAASELDSIKLGDGTSLTLQPVDPSTVEASP